MTLASNIPKPGPYGWDWSATTHDALGSDTFVSRILWDMVEALDPAYVLPGKGIQGWTESTQVFDDRGDRIGEIFHGGRTDVHVRSTSAAADSTRERVASLHNGRSARVDTRVDTLMEYDDIAGVMMRAASSYGSKVVRMESVDPRTGESLGRTLYLGAPTSAVRVRLYEKHLESPGQYEPGTNRVEVQLRPPSKMKADVSTWSREQTFCASRVTTELADLLGSEVAEAGSLHIARGTPDLEKSLEAMGHQYGPAARRWAEHQGGDLSRIWEHLFRDPRAGNDSA